MPNLFARLTRYPLGVGINRAEDRVTEALGATLSAAPDAARELVRALTDVDLPSASPHTCTQRRAEGLDRVDVEVRFGPEPEPDLRVWLELKDRDEPRRDQIDRYREARPDLRGERIVKLVTRSGVVTPFGLENDHKSWQIVGTTLDRWHTHKDPERHDAAMVREMVAYLKQEGFYVAGCFTSDDLDALRRVDAAQARLRTVVSTAAILLEEGCRFKVGDWSGATSPRWSHGPRNPADFWRAYKLTKAALPPIKTAAGPPMMSLPPDPIKEWEADVHGQKSWFEWQGRVKPAREEDADEKSGPIFGAGIAVMVVEGFDEDRYAEWLTKCRNAGFEYARGSDAHDVNYLMRYASPLKVLGGGDLDEQGRKLKEWVLASFRWLAKCPPYASP